MVSAIAMVVAVTVTLALLPNGESTAGAGDSPAAQDPSRADGRGGVKLRKLGEFDSPTYIASAPGFDDLLFVVERAGRIVALRDGKPAGTFLDIGDLVSTGGERGLLSVAFPPDYRSSGRFYVYYTDRDGDIQVDHFRRSSGSAVRADEASRAEIITVPHPGASNHNGGTATFGPDGKLYMATGDGGVSSDTAQSRDSLLGKLLRIDPRPQSQRGYAIPEGNPFRGRQGEAEIFARGLRNPFRFSFDSRKTLLAIGDVGEDAFEEIDYLRVSEARGANFGWPVFEGPSRHSSGNLGGKHDAPMHAYRNDGERCAVTGGVTVRDEALKSLRGRYLYADVCAGELRSFEPLLARNDARGDRALGPELSQPVAFGEDRGRHVYVVSLDGGVFRLVGKK